LQDPVKGSRRVATAGSLRITRPAMFALLVLIVCVAAVVWIRRSRPGRKMLAVRDSERRRQKASTRPVCRQLGRSLADAQVLGRYLGCPFVR
jgi:hypothetical protein